MMSKKVREEAVLLLSALGSKTMSDDTAPGAFFDYAEHLGISDDGMSAARAAYDAIPTMQGIAALEGGCTAFARECLEAAQLVAEGWEKGDQLVLKLVHSKPFTNDTNDDDIAEGVN